MKIVILGAGQVGSNLAAELAGEANDITLVDTDEQRLRELQDRIDISTTAGRASLPSVLQQAGVDEADMIIAVTNSDEVNMVACQIAYTLYRTPTKIARIRTPNLQRYQKDLFEGENRAFPVDVVISPEALVTDYINRLILTPGALQVLDFAEGQVQMVGVRISAGSMLVGTEIRYLRSFIPNIDTRVVAVYRQNRAITPHADTVIEEDDEVFLIADRKDLRVILSELRRQEQPYKRILIAGGGNIGFRLASTLESRHSVKVIEHSEERANLLAESLSQVLVLQGDSSDQELLIAENVEDIDVFIAVTNDDEANIMSSLLAKRLGARKVMTLINNPAYVDLVQGGEIDIAISPSQATLGSLLTHVRRGDIVNVHSLRRGAAEAIEAIAHGDKRSSKVVGRRLDEIDLPSGTTIGAIVRGSQVLIAHDDLVVETDDHVILFVINKRRLRDVERLFQVGLTFF